MEQARVAVCHAFGFTYKQQMSNLLPYGVYTIPEVSCVGLSEEEAREKQASTTSSGARSSATTRAARSSATPTAW